MNKIKQSHLFNDKIKFEINDTYNTIDKAYKARLDLFNLHSMTQYNKILYLDTDIIVSGNINKVFEVCKNDLLYVSEEGNLEETSHDFYGQSLFTKDEIQSYTDKSAFSSSVLLFKNSKKMKFLFDRIKEDIVQRCHFFNDQPHIIYVSFKYKLFDNKCLTPLNI